MKNLIYGTLLAIGLAGCQNNQPKPEVCPQKLAEVYHFTLDGISTYYRVGETNCALSFENPEYSILLLDRGCNESLDVVIASKKFKRSDFGNADNVKEFDKLITRAKEQAIPPNKVNSFGSVLDDFVNCERPPPVGTIHRWHARLRTRVARSLSEGEECFLGSWGIFLLV